MEHIAIFHLIGFAFDTHFSGLFGGLFAIKRHKIIIGNGFGANKSTLKITMNYTSGLRGQRALRDGPSARFLGALPKVVPCFCNF